MQLFATYQAAALRTAQPMETVDDDLQHAALGLVSKASEFASAINNHLNEGAELDRAAVKKKLRDMLWFITLGAAGLSTTLAELAQENIEELARRHPEKFSDLDTLGGCHVS